MISDSCSTELIAADSSDPRALRSLLGQFATGVTAITTRGVDGRKIGMTANSFSSVSLDPPLVLWSLARTAASLNDFVATSHFAVNVLGGDQHDLSGHFARPSMDKFADVAHLEGTAGVPMLEGAIATQYERGDHLIFLGEIEHYRHSGGEPLVFHAGKYRLAVAHPSLGH